MRLTLICFAVIVGITALPALADEAQKARRLHARAIVVDTHVDAPYKLEEKWADVGKRGATPHFDIPRALEGGLTAPFFAVYVPASYAEAGGAAREALDLIDLVQRVVQSHPKELTQAFSTAEIRRAKRDRKIAVLMGIEGGHAIEDSLGALREFHRLGVRYMTLTHTNTNHWADSSGKFYLPDFNPADYQVHHGLSDFGREVVREMNRIGMMVDVSHVSDETIDDVLGTSRAPVFASHSSCRAICDIPRNLTDDQIRRIAAKGGVVMINVSSYFVDPAVVEAMNLERAKLLPAYLKIKQDLASDPKRRDEAIGKLFRRHPATAHVLDEGHRPHRARHRGRRAGGGRPGHRLRRHRGPSRGPGRRLEAAGHHRGVPAPRPLREGRRGDPGREFSALLPAGRGGLARPGRRGSLDGDAPALNRRI